MSALPKTIANCRILTKLGQGGMGAVYRAVHMALGRYMAIKILPLEFTQDAQYITRFMREARAIASFTHPNIVVVHDAGEQDGHYYIAMELIDGAGLDAILRECNSIPEHVALRFLEQAAQGLGYAHDRGLVHRDIKPENLLINRDGILKVVDFGLVMEASNQTHLTRPGSVLGTPTFMSPEQCEGDVADARSDLYSLGASFYRVIAGRSPFHSRTMLDVMYKHRFEPPRPLDPSISAPTRELILKLMAKKREDRHQSAKELLDDVAKALAALPPPAHPWSLQNLLSVVAPPLPPPPTEFVAGLGKHPGAAEPSNASPAVPTPAAAAKQGEALTPPPGVFEPTVLMGRHGHTPSSHVVLPAPDQATPLPPETPGAAPSKRRRRLWAAVATCTVLMLVWAGWDYYRSSRQVTVERYIGLIDRFCAEGNLDDANAQLFLALATYPEEPRLKGLRQELAERKKKLRQREMTAERQSVRKEVKYENLLASAEKASAEKQYDQSLRLFDEALALGVETEDLQVRIRSVRFARLKALADEAEGADRWADALNLAQQAQEFGDVEERVQRLKQRVKIEALRTEAAQCLKNNGYLAAADKYEAAAGLAVFEPDLKKELAAAALQQRLTYRLDLADQAEKRHEFNGAIAELNAALTLAPEHEAIRKRLEETQAMLDRETSFDSAMDLGRKALEGKRWAEAAGMFNTALRHKKDSTEARALLVDAEKRGTIDRARGLAQTKSWRQAQALLAAVKPAPAGMETDLERLEGEIQGNLDRIAAQENQARQFEKDGALDQAVAQYLSLEELNPTERATYVAALTALRIEQAFRERLNDGDLAARAGELPKARTCYRQALEKKRDPAAQAIVQQRLDAVAVAEKLTQIDALIQARNWDAARTDLAALPADPPEGALALRDALSARQKAVGEALSRIATLEADARKAVEAEQWEAGRAALAELQELNPARAEAYRKELAELEAKKVEKAKEKITGARSMKEVQELLEQEPDGVSAADLIRQAQEKAAKDAEKK